MHTHKKGASFEAPPDVCKGVIPFLYWLFSTVNIAAIILLYIFSYSFHTGNDLV